MKKTYKFVITFALFLGYIAISFGQRPTIFATSRVDFSSQLSSLGDVSELCIDGNLDNVDFSLLRSLTSLSRLDLSSLEGDVLEHGSFQRFEMLREVILPSSLKLVDGYAFNGCLNLHRVVFGDNLQTISGHAFQGCSSLAVIELPSTIKSIGSFAFFYSNRCIYNFNLPSKSPPLLGYMPFSSRLKAVLYVSTEVVEEYRSARGWADYFRSGNRTKAY